jgi:hypothetical protein
MKKLLVGSVLVLSVAGMAFGAGLQIESRAIEAAPGQEILVMATGTGNFNDVNLQLKVGDGGAALGGTDEPGVHAAPITNVDWRSNGSLFAGVAAGVETVNTSGLVAFPSFSIAAVGVTRAAPGVIATLILDATGLAGKQFPISLSIPEGGVVSDFGAQQADSLVDGMITVIPEPASLLLLLAAVPFLRRSRR